MVAASTQCTSSRKTTSGRRRHTSRKNALSSRFKRSCDAACIWGSCPGDPPTCSEGATCAYQFGASSFISRVTSPRASPRSRPSSASSSGRYAPLPASRSEQRPRAM